MNKINYLNHTLYKPDTYHRRFDLDLPEENTKLDWKEQAKRIGNLSLPFLALIPSFSTPLSVGMGSFRVLSLFSNTLSAAKNQNWSLFSAQLLHTAVSVFCLAGTLFRFTIGLLLSTLMDMGQGLYASCQQIAEGNLRQAVDETLQLLASAAYMGFMIGGALELMLIFSCLQTVICLLQGQKEFSQGKYLEAIAKMGMGAIRARQTKQYANQIKQRNALFAMQKYAALIRRSLKGRQVRHLLENPLSHFREKEQTLTGSHFHGHGKSLVKGANLTFRTKTVLGQELTELDFKVNHVFHDAIQQTIDELSLFNNAEIEEILTLTQSHAKGITIEKNHSLPLGDGSMGNATKISVKGLGSLFFSLNATFPTMYDRVVVQMESNKNIYDVHELLSFLDIDQSLEISTQPEMERLKIGHLFRTFYPGFATRLERSEAFFLLPIDQLKAKMIEQCPDMKAIFEDHLDTMTPKEILPGRVRYQIEGLAEKAYERGARGLTATLTGAYSSAELYQRTASILKMGMLSSESRKQADLGINGLSTSYDFYTGGADSVFTQLITETNCENNLQFSTLYYHGKIRFMISLDALETGTYQYLTDSFGTRNYAPSWRKYYESRPGILEFVDELQTGGHFPGDTLYGGNEVMIKERVDPSLLTRIVVSDEQTKKGLIDYLRKCDLFQKNLLGQETILGRKADEFVTVATQASEDLFERHSQSLNTA